MCHAEKMRDELTDSILNKVKLGLELLQGELADKFQLDI